MIGWQQAAGVSRISSADLARIETLGSGLPPGPAGTYDLCDPILGGGERPGLPAAGTGPYQDCAWSRAS
jgi:hypothetical protein